METQIIETKGDQIQDRPLHEVGGSDFFVKEIDAALERGDVDFAVHSFKDMALARPEGIIRAAIPMREFAHDVLLIKPQVLLALRKSVGFLRIGTSAPRRVHNLPKFLPRWLGLSKGTELRCEVMRGNVNSRLEKLANNPEMDAIVVAAAGLIRLLADPRFRPAIEASLLPFQILLLPLELNPSAPAQGALVIECLEKNKQLRTDLQVLHDEATEKSVDAERELLKEWGGGCHLALGATAIRSGSAMKLFVRGTKPSGETVEEVRSSWSDSAPEIDLGPHGVGLVSKDVYRHHSKVLRFAPLTLQRQPGERIRWIATHPRTLPDLFRHADPECDEILVAGGATAEALLERGFPVHASAESFGIRRIVEVMRKMSPSSFREIVLTHLGAVATWREDPRVEIHASYEVLPNRESLADVDFTKIRAVFWSSTDHFAAMWSLLPPGVRHFVGSGRTREKLLEDQSRDPDRFKNIVFESLPDEATFRKLVQKKQVIQSPVGPLASVGQEMEGNE